MAIQRRTKRQLFGIGVVVFCLWLGFVRYIDWAMHLSPERFGQVMARMPMPAYFLFPFETMWTQARRGTLNEGNTAPDFAVENLDDKTSVRLASLWTERPVVLVFGSYT